MCFQKEINFMSLPAEGSSGAYRSLPWFYVRMCLCYIRMCVCYIHNQSNKCLFTFKFSLTFMSTFHLEAPFMLGGWNLVWYFLNVTRASKWDWLTVGQGLLSLQQVRVKGECYNFFCFFPFIHFPASPVPLFHLLYCLFYSPFLMEMTQDDPQGLTCR